jgi:hypothetical protein
MHRFYKNYAKFYIYLCVYLNFKHLNNITVYAGFKLLLLMIMIITRMHGIHRHVNAMIKI